MGYETIEMVIVIMGIVLKAALVCGLIYTYKGAWKQRLLIVVACIVMGIVCDDLCNFFLTRFEADHLLIKGAIGSTVVFAIVIVMMYYYIKSRKNKELEFSNWMFAIYIPVFVLFALTMALDNMVYHEEDGFGRTKMLMGFVFLVLLLAEGIRLYEEKGDMKAIKEQAKAYEEQLSISSESEQKIGALRHDMKNHLLTINQLAVEDNCGEIKKYIELLWGEMTASREYVATGNFVIDSFLNMKLDKISKLGTEIDLKIEIPEEAEYNLKDMSIILGNLLDNSISALEECKGRRWLSLSIKEGTGSLYIYVANSFEGEINTKGGRIVSSCKGVHQGIGLENVRRTVEQYGGQIDIDYSKDAFEVAIILFI